MSILRPLPALAALLVVASPAAFAQTLTLENPERPRITVIGTGEARAAPDHAMLNLTVLRTAETAEAALEEANSAAGDVRDALREAGVEGRDLQTGGFSITPQYRYENRPDGTTVPPEIVGYEVRNTLSARVRDLDGLGEILDRAVSLGVNQGGDISFGIEDPSGLENDARRQAVERARSSAEALAEAAGRSLGTVLTISDETSSFEPPRPMAMEARAMAASADMAVPVEIGENTVTARVRVVFELGEASAD